MINEESLTTSRKHNRVGRIQSPSHVTWTYGSVSGDSIMNICYAYIGNNLNN